MIAEIFGVDGIIVVVVVAMVLFGGSQIPKLARSLGSARREFTQGLREDSDETVTVHPVMVPVPALPALAESHSPMTAATAGRPPLRLES
jgi:sec-independent protein translocase protein TatA